MAARFEVEKFDGKGDFSLWKKKMKTVLVQQKVAITLADPKEYPEDIKPKEKKEIEEVAFSTVILYLSDNVLRQVHDATTAREVWASLDKIYLTKSLTNKLYLKEKFFGFRMDTSKDLEQNLDDFNRATLDLNNIGETVSDENKAIILLNSLPESYSEVKTAIKYGRDSLTLDIVLNALRSRELEIKKTSRDGEAHLTRGRPEKKVYKNNGNRGKSESSRGRSKSQGKTKRCYYCHKEGHIRRNCYELKNKRKAENNKPEEANNANVTEGYDSAEVLTVSADPLESEWILDSGCSFHMTPHRHWFQEFQPVSEGKVLLGNHQECSVQGIGTIQVKMFDNQVRILSNVRFVPELKRSLLSLGEFDKAGYTCKLENGTLKIVKGAIVKLKGKLEKGLYHLIDSTIVGTAAVTSLKEQQAAKLWHMRLGHVSEKGLMELNKQGLLGKGSIGSLELCEHCIYGKTTIVSFGKGKHTSKTILEYVHSDLWGPEKTPSLGGARYFLSIVDDFSRRVWVYLERVIDNSKSTQAR
ncbi:hypothetical protein OC713_02560 [Sweet potato little leaf phytoplasma]|uniref:hypothetical protein n=1 Tax=Candidatus Phytoplasma australasiaticum TaxID=2754999 RepID=UPI002713CA71|nr:hypothetical protein [Sweet potato little leaf phytoplasma]MDO7987387.1 hypothetical protein [Sweet potato little leaf phytoplasma]